MRTKAEPRPRPLIPETALEERRAQAEHHIREIRRIVQETQARKQQMFEALTELVGEPGEADRERAIWAGLVRFANAKVDGGQLPLDVVYALRATITLCVHGTQDLEEIQGEVLRLEPFDDVYAVKKARKVSADEAFSALAAKFHPQLRKSLEWIADPNRMSQTDRRSALSFLVEHGEQGLASVVRHNY